MAELKIGAIVDENESGLLVKIKRGNSTKMEIPFGFDATPKIISEKLLELGTIYKYEDGRIRLGEMLISVADEVQGTDEFVVNGHIISDYITIYETEFDRKTPNNLKDSGNDDDDDDAILEVVRL